MAGIRSVAAWSAASVCPDFHFMIILRLFFIIFIIFVVLVMGLGAALWLKIRFFLQNPFAHPDGRSRQAHDDKTIEGQYRVIDEPQDRNKKD